jgi:superfamily II DNA/RNA helicase
MTRNCPLPSTLVLDEADLLLQGAPSCTVQRILEDFSGQTVLAAATIHNILTPRIHRRWSTAVWARDDQWHSFYRSSVKAHFIAAKAKDKFVQLATEALPLVLEGASAEFVRVLVFCDTPKHASEVAAFLAERGWPVSTKPSEEVGKLEIVCVTDGSGRGVDWKDVRGVVNFNAPGDVQTFLHRTGRLQAVRESPIAAATSTRVCGALVTLVTTQTPEERRINYYKYTRETYTRNVKRDLYDSAHFAFMGNLRDVKMKCAGPGFKHP